MFDVFNVLSLTLLCLSIVFPFWQQIVLSLSTPAESMRLGLHLTTPEITFKAYARIFAAGQIARAYYWTIVRIVAGTSLTIVITSLLAYPLSKRSLPLRNLWTGLLVFTMYFGGGLIPTYLLIKNLGLMNSIWALIWPGAVGAFNVLLMRNFFMSLPGEIEESAKIDGAGEYRILFTMIMPLSMPILSTVALWTIVGHWNAWFDAMIYIQRGSVIVIQKVLRQVLLENQLAASGLTSVEDLQKQTSLEFEFTPESVKAAILVISTLPVLMVYPFLQKHFVKGIIIGSLKG